MIAKLPGMCVSWGNSGPTNLQYWTLAERKPVKNRFSLLKAVPKFPSCKRSAPHRNPWFFKALDGISSSWIPTLPAAIPAAENIFHALQRQRQRCAPSSNKAAGADAAAEADYLGTAQWNPGKVSKYFCWWVAGETTSMRHEIKFNLKKIFPLWFTHIPLIPWVFST